MWEIENGAPYWLDSREEAAMMERNKRFVRMPAESETFDTLFEIATPDMADAQWLYASEINQRLHPTRHKPMSRSESNHFRDFMLSLHAQTKRSNGGYKYLVREKKA